MDENKMDNHLTQGHTSEYPDPEESGLSFPWLDQYQPIDAEELTSRLQPMLREGSAPRQVQSPTSSRYGLRDHRTPSYRVVQEGYQQQQSAVLDDSEDDPEFVEPDVESGQEEAMSQEDAEEPADDSRDESNEACADFRPRKVGRAGRRGKQGLGRGRGRPRGSSRGRSRGRPRGRPRHGAESRGRGGKGLKRGPRPALEPSQEFAALQKEAVDVFIDHHDFDKALNLIQQAISINPEVYAAHALMSEIYFAKGDDERGVASLFSGAHAAPRDAGVWHQVADACLQKPSLDRHKALQQAAYCFARIVAIDPNDFDSRFQRAAINRELGLFTSAIREFDKVLAEMPHNPSIIQQIAEICLELGEIDKAKVLYRDCIAYHKANGLHGDNTFSWSDVNLYVELFSTQGDFEEAIANLKSLSRWLLGRVTETFWDKVVDDDREWDPADDPRRVSVSQHVAGKYSSDSYGFGLPLELRAKLGIYRLNMGKDHRSEALNHFEWLEPEDTESGAKVFDYADLFREIGEALREAKEYAEALRFLQPLKVINAFSDTEFWISVAASFYVCGDVEQARECYEHAKLSDKYCAEARTQLAKIYKDMGRPDEALRNAQEALEIGRRAIIRPRRRRYERREAREAREAAERELMQRHRIAIPSVQSTTARLEPMETQDAHGRYRLGFVGTYAGRNARAEERAAKRKKIQQMSAEEAENYRTNNVQSLHKRLREMTAAMRNGDIMARNTWLECADELLHDFRSNRVFYPSERHVKFEGFDVDSRRRAIRKRWAKGDDEAYEAEPITTLDDGTPIPSIESSIPTEYRGITFDTWLDIFLEQALTLAKLGESFRGHCYETIVAVLDCTVWYHHPESMLKAYICYLTCALALNDGDTLSTVVVRWFMKEYQFVTDAYRLFAALNLLYSSPVEQGGRDIQIRGVPFRQAPTQKFLFRQIRAVDLYLPRGYNQEGVDGPVPHYIRDEEGGGNPEAAKARLTSRNQDAGELIKPEEMDVALLCLYASIMYTGGSFPNALHYYYRAYALDPKNPMLLMNMALCYLHQNFKRQNENRHYYIMQGLAFFQEYTDACLAKAEGQGQQVAAEVQKEIEFNRARIWNMLNLTNLAVEGYKKVIDTSMVEVTNTGRTREAAYAMQTAYALSGDMVMAQRITEKWLVI